jgi:hypothetical protein
MLNPSFWFSIRVERYRILPSLGGKNLQTRNEICTAFRGFLGVILTTQISLDFSFVKNPRTTPPDTCWEENLEKISILYFPEDQSTVNGEMLNGMSCDRS